MWNIRMHSEKLVRSSGGILGAMIVRTCSGTVTNSCPAWHLNPSDDPPPFCPNPPCKRSLKYELSGEGGGGGGFQSDSCGARTRPEGVKICGALWSKTPAAQMYTDSSSGMQMTRIEIFRGPKACFCTRVLQDVQCPTYEPCPALLLLYIIFLNLLLSKC